MKLDHDAHQALLTERDENTSTDDWGRPGRDTVGESHVQRDRERNVAKFGH
jgi:hypothetical protein